MNKDVSLKVNVDEVRTTKYFQPVITNNTVIIPAKRLQDEVSETTDKSPSNDNLLSKFNENNLTTNVQDDIEANVENISKCEVPTYKNLNNLKLQEPKEEKSKLDELKIEEIIIEEVKEDKKEVKTDKDIKNDFMIKLEDMAKIFEEKQVAEQQIKMQQQAKKEAISQDTKNAKEESNVTSQAYEGAELKKDITRKMDLPFVEGMETESIPQRREIVDNLNEMKSKLFLLASNAKKPVRICVNKKVFLMGSDYAKMDCVIRNNRYISRCHAKIYYEAGCYFIEDVGSMNGTYINGVKLAEGIKYKLETGDMINLADCKFEVDIKN